MPDSDDFPAVISVRSGVTPDGVYTCEISYTPDIARTLRPDEIGPYADALTTAALIAEYDAAVMRQMRQGMSVPTEEAAVLLSSLHKARLDIDQAAMAPMIVTPCVSALTGQPFLSIALVGDPLTWQWEPADALHHAGGVREATIVADLDAAFRRVLVGTIGISDGEARIVVDALARYRHPRLMDSECHCH